MNSREKGKRGERQWRDELRANGYRARRGQQFAGGSESPDVVCEELDWIHFEVKAVERLNIEDAMEQARRDQARLGCNAAAAAKIPIVAHKRSHRRWLVTMEAAFFFQLLRGELPGNETNRTDGTNDGAHGVTRPSKTISGVFGETPALPGTNNKQQQNQNNESGGHRPPLQDSNNECGGHRAGPRPGCRYKRKSKHMKMKTNSGNFQPCPEYTGSAVCVDVTPLKTVQTQYGPKEKFRFVFEIGETKDDGSSWCVWSAPFTPSYHENAALRPFLRKWMGRELSPDEIKNFDTEDLLGRTAHLTVIHEHAEAEVYANIALIQPDKSAQPLKPSGKFVRMKDRQTQSGHTAAGQAAPAGNHGGYRRTEQPAVDPADLGATKIHVGKCKGLEVRDLSPEQVGALIEKWLPTAKANAKPTADDKRLIAALESWQAAALKAIDDGTVTNEDDNVPY